MNIKNLFFLCSIILFFPITANARLDPMAHFNAKESKKYAKKLMARVVEYANQIDSYKVDSLELRSALKAFAQSIREVDNALDGAEQYCVNGIRTPINPINENFEDDDIRASQDECVEKFSSSIISDIKDYGYEVELFLEKGKCRKRYGFLGLRKKEYACEFPEFASKVMSPMIKATRENYTNRSIWSLW